MNDTHDRKEEGERCSQSCSEAGNCKLKEEMVEKDVKGYADEEHFSLSGNVNYKNCVHWAEENPRYEASAPLHEVKVIVWCGIGSTFVLCPYFSEDVTSISMKTCSITNSRYTTMLQNYVIPELHKGNVVNDIVCIQDGAPTHVATCVRQVLQQHFGDRVIYHNFGVFWPPRYPGLTPMDFWFLGYLKSKVYTPNPRDLSEMKDAIKHEVIQAPPCYVRHCWKKSPVCNALSSAKVGTLKTWNSNKRFFPFPLLCCHWSFTMLSFENVLRRQFSS
ncbi:hypothetical protein AVEN_66405-1 [Araneus ventricosus]|uniref:Tc1-like transposase DDE domain-containing protein n=1 Tax=Araneus ventricosus TaxID=182803 RepID=A0A4Y2EFC6_ARAVE|nr:hypothetical protein AVEN_66405-1 [Araneus ventricosus]